MAVGELSDCTFLSMLLEMASEANWLATRSGNGHESLQDSQAQYRRYSYFLDVLQQTLLTMLKNAVWKYLKLRYSGFKYFPV